MKRSMIAVFAATLSLAACGMDTTQNTLAALQAACNAGKTEACRMTGLHAQVRSDDAAIEAGIDAALLSAVQTGMAQTRETHPRYYAQAMDHRH